ncbi:GAF domain-containing sensor histidine kinase [Roseivivax sp. GX 12232]|uniref:GAF domain-containing sensor histidine kinase n=1 Tax=Roseivivax sp. GX 12232 TaxID=2900547 RepID=UPI001E42A766|nr:GAF domain-containing sensor histidine kinase [Roseivivax sp. GX 12232]MCE0507301.1 GAF domain-containing sensor histidine kinase [Roseivivax sp. GX 12232]
MTRSAITFPFASNEHARLRELREVVDPERSSNAYVQDIAERAADMFGTPAALVSIVEADHQWFLGKTGINLEMTPRDYSICSRTIMSDRPLILPDTLKHEEFSAHPAVMQAPNVRFYAGAPIVLRSGFRVGSVCALDVSPHEAPSQEKITALQNLAAEVAQHIETQHQRRSGDKSVSRQKIVSDARQEFLNLIGHEFRTPLTVLLGNARLLRASATGEIEIDPQKLTHLSDQAISAVIASGEHLQRLIEHVMRFSDLQSGELMIAEETIQCRDLLDAVVAPISPIITASHRNVRTDCSDEVQTIKGDGEQLCVALSSLVTNAVTHGRGDIKLFATRGEDQTLRIVCSDEGEGPSEEQLNRSDRPFAIYQDLSTRKTSGLGLGLPLARKITQLHGGRLQRGRNAGSSWVELVLPGWRCGLA